MNTHRKIAVGLAAATVLLLGSGVAAARTAALGWSHVSFVQQPAPPVPTPEPSNAPDISGQPDLPEAGDVPDAPDQADAPDVPGQPDLPEPGDVPDVPAP